MKKLSIITMFFSIIINSVFANEVNVFSARHYDSDVQLYEKFTTQTGIKVNVVSGKDKALQKRITEEGADCIADLSLGLALGSFDPNFAATVISFESLEKILERCLSILPFLCLIPAQCE